MTSQELQSWLESQKIIVENGIITGAPPPDSSTTTLTLLGHERLLTFGGEENRKFLQGQLTCDVVKLADGQTTLGACCTPKGRMVANFRMVALGSDLIVSLPAEQAAYLKGHLGKYAAFFRTVTITDTSDTWLRIGLNGPQAADIVTDLTSQPVPSQGTVNHWSHGLALAVNGQNARFEVWIRPDAPQVIWQQLCTRTRPANTVDWQLADIQDGIAWVTEESRESWIPQHLNWQALAGVSFTKGCYTGQEIVARMKYLGKLKSRLYRLTVQTDTVPAASAIINNSRGGKTGEVVTALPTATGTVEILAVVRNEDAEAGGLILAEQGTPLNLQPLPYQTES